MQIPEGIMSPIWASWDSYKICNVGKKLIETTVPPLLTDPQITEILL